METFERIAEMTRRNYSVDAIATFARVPVSAVRRALRGVPIKQRRKWLAYSAGRKLPAFYEGLPVETRRAHVEARKAAFLKAAKL